MPSTTECCGINLRNTALVTTTTPLAGQPYINLHIRLTPHNTTLPTSRRKYGLLELRIIARETSAEQHLQYRKFDFDTTNLRRNLSLQTPPHPRQLLTPISELRHPIRQIRQQFISNKHISKRCHTQVQQHSPAIGPVSVHLNPEAILNIDA